ncbi:rhomboid family intramembrane serine protease [Microvirga sp. CF3062]|uniref:rhomboid family intramembrane serine protease n=1 Tax=Microvirga sp. CF3062 TaxID=3110182 RepID=UPI002E76B727|nr:rhomboid family intramembrane serine protease [Microvirga sp. CF3062]MEE1658151.1 rhomboid family intramembrane serine protease [Microvirga sp. CF3062]
MSPNPPRAREPILNLPAVIALCLLALIGIHAVRLLLSDESDFMLIIDWSVIPARWSVAFGSVQVEDVMNYLREGVAEDTITPLMALAQYVLDGQEGRPWTALSYAFLHGSWAHVLINSVWLAAFGTPIVRRCGGGRFFILSAAAAIAGAVLYAVMNPLQVLPMIGASGAVSGLMAAASWFMFAPASWHWEGRLTQPHERPRETPAHMIRNRQVLIFLGIWFAANYVFAFVQPLGVTDASIAWEAHLGGFLAGLVLFPLVDPLPARAKRISA